MTESSKPPPHVRLIQRGEIRLAELGTEELCALRGRGLDPRPRLLGGWSLRLPEPSGDLLEDEALSAAVTAIAEAGIAFLWDPRMGWSPADVAEELRARGLVRCDGRICSFNGSRWILMPLT